MNKKSLWNALKYLLPLPLLAFGAWKYWEDFGNVWHKHVVEREPIHGGYLVLAAVIGSASILLTFVRWFMLVRAVGLPFRLVNALRLGLVGFFFNTFLPGSVGGDLIKAYFIAREQSRRTVAVATVLIDRALALWALVWFVAILGVIFWFQGLLQGEVETALHSIVVSAVVIVLVTLLVWVGLGFLPAYRADRFAGRLSRLPKVGHSASEFWRAVWMYRCQQRSVLAAMLLSFVGFVGFVLTFYFLVLGLWDPGQKIPSGPEHFLIIPIGMVIEAVPGFPGGAGIGELGYGGLYELLGCAGGMGVLGSVMKRILYALIGLVGYLIYLGLRPSIQSMAEKPAGDLVEVETCP